MVHGGRPGGAARPLEHEVLEELPGEVHHPQAVLHPRVLRAGEHVVRAPQLLQAPQPAHRASPDPLCTLGSHLSPLLIWD